ncbi:serine/threonine-protein kinase [Cryobacterium sp. 10C2]|uniref:serine/threonine protein kinase n=1 Tax=Cryobacterium sp. 10C2 TaxID=3048576 RepID=UPI002AB3BD2E|nr:serine/threonine-protein kinase [Cryobacterium sp. 10C2]MDY7528140.1 serine/threonine-protein kinase [Cryobacterium sp. 10C2]MEB0292436.1 serine/threonine-protein kinase [Cryobacterium sp. 10C2]
MTLIPLIAFDALPAGFIIGNRYEVISSLGKGGQGVVYAVLDHHLQEESALKILLSSAPSEVWREASLLTRLSGKFLLPVRNADLASGLPFVVTEIAQHGTTFDEMIPNIGIPPERAVQWVIHASRGASRMHDQGLLHNDLKPENLFLNSNGDALLGDLGLASEMNSSGFAPLTGGTPATMSPEVAAAALVAMTGAPIADPCSVASDVYSLGASLYWLLAGRAPYNGNDVRDTLTRVTAGPPASLSSLTPHVPRGIRDVVEKSMSRLPSDRYPNAGDFDYALAKHSYPKRKWSRQPSHPGHEECFVGVKSKSTLEVCASTQNGSSHMTIAVTHQPSGRNAIPLATATRAQLPQRLRSIFRNFN